MGKNNKRCPCGSGKKIQNCCPLPEQETRKEARENRDGEEFTCSSFAPLSENQRQWLQWKFRWNELQTEAETILRIRDCQSIEAADAYCSRETLWTYGQRTTAHSELSLIFMAQHQLESDMNGILDRLSPEEQSAVKKRARRGKNLHDL